jgi:dolichol-phosphate mannosyltransferase
MPPEFIPRLLEEIKGYDISIGSRYVRNGGDRRSFDRWLTSRMINLFANFVLSFKVKDFNSGFVAARRDVFRKVKISQKGYGQYCIRFLYSSLRQGYKIREIGYVFTDRSRGKSKTAENFLGLLGRGWEYGSEILRIRFNRKDGS